MPKLISRLFNTIIGSAVGSALIVIAVGALGEAAQARTLEPKVLEITFGVFRPPYVYEKKDMGLDVEVAQAVFKKMNRKIKVNHAPNQRGWKEIESGRIDGLVGVTPEEDHRDLFFSAPMLFYDNVAISKAKNKIKIERIPDLKNYRFLSFEKAVRYLGPEYEEVVRGVKRDTDVSSQLTQNKLFWNDKVEVIILDLNVFRHYQKQLKDEGMNVSDEVVIHRIFPERASWRCVVFRDRGIRDEFNKALDQIRAEGLYQKILDKYLKTEPM